MEDFLERIPYFNDTETISIYPCKNNQMFYKKNLKESITQFQKQYYNVNNIQQNFDEYDHDIYKNPKWKGMIDELTDRFFMSKNKENTPTNFNGLNTIGSKSDSIGAKPNSFSYDRKIEFMQTSYTPKNHTAKTPTNSVPPTPTSTKSNKSIDLTMDTNPRSTSSSDNEFGQTDSILLYPAPIQEFVQSRKSKKSHEKEPVDTNPSIVITKPQPKQFKKHQNEKNYNDKNHADKSFAKNNDRYQIDLDKFFESHSAWLLDSFRDTIRRQKMYHYSDIYSSILHFLDPMFMGLGRQYQIEKSDEWKQIMTKALFLPKNDIDSIHKFLEAISQIYLFNVFYSDSKDHRFVFNSKRFVSFIILNDGSKYTSIEVSDDSPAKEKESYAIIVNSLLD